METIEVVEVTIHEDGSRDEAATTAVALASMGVAQQASALCNLAFSNQVGSTAVGAQGQVAHQDAMNRLRQLTLARAVSGVRAAGPLAARPAVFVLSSNAMAQDLADLQAAVKALVPVS
jgi:hypothetical protein